MTIDGMPLDEFNSRMRAAVDALVDGFAGMGPSIDQITRDVTQLGIALSEVENVCSRADISVAVKRYNGRLRYERRMRRAYSLR